MSFQSPPDPPAWPGAGPSTPVEPNVLHGAPVPGDAAPPPKRRSRAMIVGGIAILAGLIGSVGGKILIGLLAANVAGAALSSVFGGPFDKLPGDVKDGFEKRLETAIGNRLDGKSDSEKEAQVTTWLRSGFSRLNDASLVRHLELEVEGLNRTDVGGCASFGRASIAGLSISSDTSNKIVGALDQLRIAEFLDLNITAIEAELRGSPAAVHVTAAQTSTAFQTMIGGLGGPELRTLQSMTSGGSATDAEVCTAIRGLYREALELDPAGKALVARFDVDPS
jgi:hypothetical protein